MKRLDVVVMTGRDEEMERRTARAITRRMRDAISDGAGKRFSSGNMDGQWI